MNYIRVTYRDGSFVARHIGGHHYEAITTVISHAEAERVVEALNAAPDASNNPEIMDAMRTIIKDRTAARKGKAQPKASKKRRELSPEARARIAKAQKARWAAYRKAKETAA